MKKSIACIAFRGREVLIAHRIQKGQMGGRWEFPGGKVENGESDEDACKREFFEEFGEEIVVKEKIASAIFKHAGEEVLLCAYLITVPHDGSEKKYVLSEHTEYKWVSLSEIPTLHFVDSDMLIYPEIAKYLATVLQEG